MKGIDILVLCMNTFMFDCKWTNKIIKDGVNGYLVSI